MAAKVKIVKSSELDPNNLTAKHYIEGKRWAWCGPMFTELRGPFKTRERALNDAKKCGAKKVSLYTVEYPDPREHFGLTVTMAIADANEVAMGSAFKDNDRIFFKVKKADLKKAQEELDELMRRWAKFWVKPTAMITKFVEVRMGSAVKLP